MSKCSECTYLKACDPDLYGRYWCEKKLERVSANQEECYRFCRAYSRSSYESKNYEQYSKEHSNEGCYLTTIMCKILKVNDNNPYLNTLRDFRKNILQKNTNYKSLLVQYDVIGPIIANNLINDSMKYKISANSFSNYIMPITKLIKKNENEKAINLYVDMTNKLIKLYNINNIVTEDIINNANIKESGHGIYKVKKIASN